MRNIFSKYQILIVGAGISGVVLAERYASIGKKVLIIEKRDHIGGNCYDYFGKNGVMVSKYGAHLFHTNYEDVWDYLQKFAKWKKHCHKVLAMVDGKLVPVPVNITTVNKIFDLSIKDQKEMDNWLKENQVKVKSCKNSEDVALSRVGTKLYKKLFKNYTKKQWDKDPRELDPSVLARIPVRNSFEDRYFSDKYQAQPIGGFTKIFKKMLSHKNIKVKLNTDFFDKKDQINLNNFEKVFYTGPVDKYFNYMDKDNKLEYRSLNFVFEDHPMNFFQENSVINYPNDFDFTRIVEYKHITGQSVEGTTISKEYPTYDGEPYYPVLTIKNKKLYAKYKTLSDKEENVYFIGRLAEYKYINMDQAFKKSLDLFEKLNKKI
jgi:UDP-galactopyranose mutase